ncbi:tyrosine--tRNA ligase [Candidatus Azambacteria bacterium]|nr:tyrosine--tRNA ligase [Candidatus Azambacteria bacterium]
MKINTDEAKIKEILERGVQDVIVKEHLEKALASGKKLRVKFGIDPTRPDLHIGHAVVLRKLKQLQDLGHRIVLLIGDFTAQIGDPSGRTEVRTPLTKEEVKKNMEGYLEQAGTIIDIQKAEVVYNSTWFGEGNIKVILELARAGSIQQVLRRADFKKRLDEDQDITLLEILYPLFQGYDSVMVRADVEIGGTDQLFNMLMGRRVQRHYNLLEQDVLTTQLLEGTDGVKKMSKSSDNYIGVAEEPNDMFGKIMSIKDELILKYFWLCTDVTQDELDAYEKRLNEGANPRDVKMELGKKIVALYHSRDAAEKAAKEFEKVFSKKELPSEIEEYRITSSAPLKNILAASGATASISAAVRLVEEGAVKINDEVETDWKKEIKGGETIQAGKRKFIKIIHD